MRARTVTPRGLKKAPIHVVKNKDFKVALAEVTFTVNGEARTIPAAAFTVKASSRLDAFTKCIALHREQNLIPPQVNIFSAGIEQVTHTIGATR